MDAVKEANDDKIVIKEAECEVRIIEGKKNKFTSPEMDGPRQVDPWYPCGLYPHGHRQVSRVTRQVGVVN